MKGYLWSPGTVPGGSEGTRLRSWEAVAVDAVGNTIEFWGFKRNQGKVWALLYLRDVALTAAEIEAELGLSKGGVSMLLKDLEQWGVVFRVRRASEAAWRYQAETDLMKMARKVVEQREFAFIGRVRADLSEARRLAEADPGTTRAAVSRLAKMEQLAEAMEKALKLFLRTSRFDVSPMFELFGPHEPRREHK